MAESAERVVVDFRTEPSKYKHWKLRLDGDVAKLWYWEEATDCPKNAVPKYEAKLDKKPPPLVGH